MTYIYEAATTKYDDDKLLLRKAMAKIQSQSTTNPSSISQAAAVEALYGPQNFIMERSKEFQKRRKSF